MRSRRLSFVAGWAAVAVLAIAGFAAFGTPDASSEEIKAEAAAASLGHTAGNYAGLTFALLGSDGNAAVLRASAIEPTGDTAADEQETSADDAGDEGRSAGTVATPTSGWLSEVEVRALVSLYFEPTDVNKAVRIAWCESRFDPNATDLRTGGVGLFNHLPKYWGERAANAGFRGADATDPEASTAAAAWEVYNGAGWQIFGCG
ncbi:MAG: transglycosylase SLT domain-containing protein [Acidimicrobiia bacterium]